MIVGVHLEYSLAGLLIGLLVGMTGMGGGSLMTPMLVLVFGFKPTVAIGTDIVHGAIFKSFGAVRHRQLGTVNLPLTLWMLLGSAPMSLAGVGAATLLEHAYGDSWEDAAKKVLGGALLVCGLAFLVKALLHPRPWHPEFRLTPGDRIRAVTIGVIGGFIVGLTSVGSGTFFGLTMMLFFPLSMAQIVGTDIVHAAALLWVAGAGHIVAGNVDFHAMYWLLLGSVPGVLVGSQFTVRAGDRVLRFALASTLFLSGVKLVDFPGADELVIAGAGLVLLAGLIALGHTLRSRSAPARLGDEASLAPTQGRGGRAP
jgi:uncharacterized membrane protein YfcA